MSIIGAKSHNWGEPDVCTKYILCRIYVYHLPYVVIQLNLGKSCKILHKLLRQSSAISDDAKTSKKQWSSVTRTHIFIFDENKQLSM